jgi:hypothetical protein
MLDERNRTGLLSTASAWAPKIRTQCRVAPERGIYKINTDAAVDRADSNAFCLGSNGEFVAASAMNMPNVTESETVEATVCTEALALAEVCAIKKMIAASDCLDGVRNIKEMTRYAYMMILQNIHEIFTHTSHNLSPLSLLSLSLTHTHTHTDTHVPLTITLSHALSCTCQEA